MNTIFQMRKLFLFFIASFMMTMKAVAQDFVLEGTIGKYPVVMELYRNGANLKGSYYYKSQGPDKRLSIHIVYKGNGVWNMTEYLDGKKNGIFTLGIPTFKVRDKWQGQYRNKENKTFSYTLTIKRAAKGAVSHWQGKIGNNNIIMEFYSDNGEEYIGNYYYTSQGPGKRLALETDGYNMGRLYIKDYQNGKEVGMFIIDCGEQFPESERSTFNHWKGDYTNANGRDFSLDAWKTKE